MKFFLAKTEELQSVPPLCSLSVYINLFLYSLMPCYGIVSLSAPGSACILALPECRLCNEFSVFVVNTNLCFVVVHLAFSARCVEISLGGLGYCGLIGGCLLRRAIVSVLDCVAKVFQLLDGSRSLAAHLKSYLNILLRSLCGASNELQVFRQSFRFLQRLSSDLLQLLTSLSALPACKSYCQTVF